MLKDGDAEAGVCAVDFAREGELEVSEIAVLHALVIVAMLVNVWVVRHARGSAIEILLIVLDIHIKNPVVFTDVFTLNSELLFDIVGPKVVLVRPRSIPLSLSPWISHSHKLSFDSTIGHFVYTKYGISVTTYQTITLDCISLSFFCKC